MRPAGLAAFEARTEANTAIYSYERDRRPCSPTPSSSASGPTPLAWADWERSAAVVPQDRDALGDERQGGGDARATARGAHRRFRGRRAGADARLARAMTPETTAVLGRDDRTEPAA